MPLNGQSRQGRVIINFFEEAVRRGLASHEEYSEPGQSHLVLAGVFSP
jgi:hypothetical protein